MNQGKDQATESCDGIARMLTKSEEIKLKISNAIREVENEAYHRGYIEGKHKFNIMRDSLLAKIGALTVENESLMRQFEQFSCPVTPLPS